MLGVKVSVSLPEEDIRYIDDYVRRTGSPSRSSALHRAVSLLRMSEIEEAYTSAWDEWQETEDAGLWDSTSGDGLGDASR